MRHKNKKSLKNLKQFRVRSKFLFYVVWRPKAQKLFFPIILALYVCGAIYHEATKDWVFENPKITAVEAIRSMSESGNTSSPATETKENPSMVKAPKASESSMSTTSPVIRASDAEAIKQVAEKYGLDWKILTAICIKESNCNPDRVGDGGKSYGAFQIHQKYHPGTIDCAKDLKCSAEWTAKRLKRHAHLGESEMVRSHNGLVANNANAYYVSDIYKIIESL